MFHPVAPSHLVYINSQVLISRITLTCLCDMHGESQFLGSTMKSVLMLVCLCVHVLDAYMSPFKKVATYISMYMV